MDQGRPGSSKSGKLGVISLKTYRAKWNEDLYFGIAAKATVNFVGLNRRSVRISHGKRKRFRIIGQVALSVTRPRLFPDIDFGVTRSSLVHRSCALGFLGISADGEVERGGRWVRGDIAANREGAGRRQWECCKGEPGRGDNGTRANWQHSKDKSVLCWLN